MRIASIVTEDGGPRKRSRPRSAAAARPVREEDVVDAPDAARVEEEGRLHDADRLRARERHPERRGEGAGRPRAAPGSSGLPRPPRWRSQTRRHCPGPRRAAEVRVLRVEDPGVREADGEVPRERAEPATIVPRVKPARASSAATASYGSFIRYGWRNRLAPTTRKISPPTTATSARSRRIANAASRFSGTPWRSSAPQPVQRSQEERRDQPARLEEAEAAGRAPPP